MREWRTLKFRAMNTEIETAVEVRTERIQAEGDPAGFVQGWFASVERRFSRFLPDNELAALNRCAGRRLLVSASMLELLRLAEEYRVWTDGIFSPFMLKALEQAGYDRTFDELTRVQADESALQAVDTANRKSMTRKHAVTEARPSAQEEALPPSPLWIDEGMEAVRLSPGTAVDLGGIAKSWAVECAVHWLRRRWEAQRGLVNAGGDVRVWGGVSPAQPWIVAIADPWRPADDAAELPLREGAVATSSVLGRRWRSSRGNAHHLIDPRTGRPAESDIVQCSVAGDDLTACETAAKTVCILGLSQGFAWLQRAMPAGKALLFARDGRIHQIGDDWEVRPS